MTSNTTDINKILKAIDGQLKLHPDTFTALGYKYGVLGLSLYNFVASAYHASPAHLQEGYAYLEKAFEMLNGGYLSRRLYKEIAELGHFLEYCKQRGFYADDTNEILDDVDELLYKHMQEELSLQNFDPVTGALAYGSYFLERVNSKPAVKGVVEELIMSVISFSFEDEKGVYWKSKLKQDDEVYLGISHGIASIILYMIHAREKGIAPGTDDIIHKAACYIKNNELKEGPLLFPVIMNETPSNELVPHNWCYGDLGTLYSVFKTGVFLDDPALQSYCLERFRKMVARKDGPPYLIAGPGLLYGYAGVAMTYHRLSELTQEAYFSEAYEKLTGTVIGMFDPGDEFLGYRGYWNQSEAVTNYSFCEGMIGIALSLMAYSDSRYHSYFNCFFNLS